MMGIEINQFLRVILLDHGAGSGKVGPVNRLTTQVFWLLTFLLVRPKSAGPAIAV